MKIETFTYMLEEIVPLKIQENYDNCGLIIGNKNKEITNVITTLDVTEEVIEEAVKNGCNLIVAHHPIVFFGMKRFNDNTYVERIISMAIKNNIAIYACHTNLDKSTIGVNRKICNKIGLENISFLSPDLKSKTVVPVNGEKFLDDIKSVAKNTEGIFDAVKQLGDLLFKDKTHSYGSGMIGELKEPEFAIDFLLRLKTTFNCGAIKHTSKFNPEIKKIAVCGGAGFSLLNNAIESKADMYITSDITYHQFFDADNRIILVDIGHYESEQFTKELIVDVIKNNIGDKDFKIHVSKINTNPVKYL